MDILQSVDILLLFMRWSIFICKHTCCINARSYGYQNPINLLNLKLSIRISFHRLIVNKYSYISVAMIRIHVETALCDQCLQISMPLPSNLFMTTTHELWLLKIAIIFRFRKAIQWKKIAHKIIALFAFNRCWIKSLLVIWFFGITKSI